MRLKILLSKKWLIPTLLVPLAVAAMVRLGMWQLDRLEQRQAHNRQVQTMLSAEAVELSAQTILGPDPEIKQEDLAAWEYRTAHVRGEYDPSTGMIIRNQAWEQQPGVHVLTPLLIQGTDHAVLVDLGWIPQEEYREGQWKRYIQSGPVEVQGMIRTSESPPAFGGQSNPTPQTDQHITAWNFIDIQAIQKQLPYSLLPVYIQAAPQAEQDSLPYRSQPDFDLTAGPHLGYAIQWFAFATVVGIGYPVYVYRKEEK